MIQPQQPDTGMRKLFLRFYLTVVICFLVSSLGIGAIYKRLIDRANQRYLTDIFDTTITIIEKELGDLPPSLWHDVVSRIADKNNAGVGQDQDPAQVPPETGKELRAKGFVSKIPVPVQIENLDAYVLSPENQDALKDGDIILLYDQDLYLHRIHDTNQMVVLGPIPYLKRMDAVSWEDWLALGLMCLALGLPTWLWLRPFWRDLMRLTRQSRALGSGDFAVRVELDRQSALAQLGATFNRMAHDVEELTASRQALINAVSHDLRTPLARLRYRLEALRGQATEAQFSAIDRDLGQIDELVQEWLTLSTLNSSKVRMELQPVDLMPWLLRLAAEHANEFVSLQVENMTGIDAPWVEMDSYYLGRALGNLINNARRYGGKQVRVGLEYLDGWVTIHVDDDGPGIPAAARERLMQPFERLDTSRNRDTGGFGLGLSIVSMIMREHSGRAEISDSPLGGARLTLSWPSSLRDANLL